MFCRTAASLPAPCSISRASACSISASPSGSPEVGAGDAVEAERACRHRQPELSRQCQGLVGGGDRLRVGAGKEMVGGELRVGGDERRARLSLLEQADGLGGEREVAALAESPGDAGEQDQRPRLRVVVAAGAEAGRVPASSASAASREAAGLEGGVCPAHEQPGPFRIVGGVSSSARASCASAWAVSRPSARSPAKARNRRAGTVSSSACSVSPAAWASSSACSVVVGEHLRQVLDPLARLALDPGAAAR